MRSGESTYLNILASIRQRQTPWTQRVLGMFIVVWLNLALQPCAMALGETSDHKCDYCPPAISQESRSTDQHESHGEGHDGHDMPACDVATADCMFLDDFDYDGRTVQLKLKDAPSDLPLAIAPSVANLPVLDNEPVFCRSGRAWDRPGVQPPLNVLFCVYQI